MATETANQQQLPCDGDGNCMLCKKTPAPEEKLTCKTCATPWHVDCLVTRPESMGLVAEWECPDCSGLYDAKSVVAGDLVTAIRAIEADSTLSEQEKAMKRQELLSGSSSGGDKVEEGKVKDDNELLDILNENLKCSFCMQLPDRPVTTPCGHTFCLKCFEKWVGQGKKTCAKCREQIPAKMASQPRINSAIVLAIRMARTTKSTAVVAPRVIQYVHNEDLPDEAFTTDRAKKTGKANAKSGKIFVTIPNDHLGPITADYDPVKNTGVLVGDCWADRLACRQWGAHFPHVSGIAGQSDFGAQSVVLSGGYEDDEDHGEWFLYTGSGGRDLSGNKRTNKEQSSDQKFTSANQALRHSCKNGYPVRVIRSHKEKRSNYAPESGVRYDGIYRIEKCWRKKGLQGFIVCRYLFVRCDNSPAPWTSDEHGDRPRALPDVPELKKAIDLTKRKESPHWDFDELEGCWKWKKSPPLSRKVSRKARENGTGEPRSKKDSNAKILKEFSCLLCRKVLTLPITTPCAHNFCKPCLDGAFEGQNFVRERKTGGRQLRTQKTVMKCPACTMDISEFLQNAQVNRELMGAIESLMRKFEDEEKSVDGDDEEDVENGDLESEETEIKQAEEEVSDKPTGVSQDENGNPKEPKTEPTVPAKRGRKKKNNATGDNDKDTENIESESKETEMKQAEEDISGKPLAKSHDENDNNPKEPKTKPILPAKRGRKRKNDATRDDDTDTENGELESKETEIEQAEENSDKPIEKSKDENGNPEEPETKAVVAAKRGRKKKNSASGKNDEDVENGELKCKETEIKQAAEEEDSHNPTEKSQDENGNPEEPETTPIASVKRGRKRKTVVTSVVRNTRGRKAQTTVEDGNVSPSSPLHVGSDNEPE